MSEDDTVALTGKAAAVLSVLTQRRGEVVSREEIMDNVWKGVHVTPDLVREYVHDIRQALGDDATTPRYIETIRGKGFRLFGNISFADSPKTAQFPMFPRIAVMRPTMVSDDPKWGNLGYSIGKGIVSRIAYQPNLSVVSFHATCGAENDDLLTVVERLSADLIVLVEISIGSEEFGVSLELVARSDYSVLATDQYFGVMDDISELHNLVADLVSAELGRFNGHVHQALLRNMRRAPPVDRTSFEEYLLSVECEAIHDLAVWKRGLEHSSRAAELDPDFARAWHMRAVFLRGLVTFFQDPDTNRDTAFAAAVEALRNSLRLDPHDPQVLVWSRHVHTADGNISAARNAVVRAADLGRNQPDTLCVCALEYCQVVGAFDEAIALIDTALVLSPNPVVWYRLIECRVAFFAGNYARSAAASEAGSAALPALLFGAMSLAAQQKVEPALRKFKRLSQSFPLFHPESYAEDMIVDETARRLFDEGLRRLYELQSVEENDVITISAVGS